MEQNDFVNPNCMLEFFGLSGISALHYNLSNAALLQHAVMRGEGDIGRGGVFLVATGTFTGRSPNDKFVVRENDSCDNIWWQNTASLTAEQFAYLRADIFKYMQGGEYFVQDLYSGADKNYRLAVRVICEFAWHGLFIRHMLRRPSVKEIFTFIPEFNVVVCPNFITDPQKYGCRSGVVIVISLACKQILICGTSYAGEIKKAIFSVLTYLLPERGIMPMHCSANHKSGDKENVAVFFGLSGTGKTTLSADSSRVLIGDDEHGWGINGIFNFEGGCYAKTLGLSMTAEPDIYQTTDKFATIIENVVYSPNRRILDFNNTSMSTNMRCAYPLEYISNASCIAMGGNPKNIIMLTCDAFGVLPPLARLNPRQAIYHFLSGFTAKIAGTEQGINVSIPTFSACFGAPFMLRHPKVYAALLHEKIMKSGAHCWLVNTGWSGGGYGIGERMPISLTRHLLHAILEGSLLEGDFRKDALFGFDMPREVEGVASDFLNPRLMWRDGCAYDAAAQLLVELFIDNFIQYLPCDDAEILAY